MKVLLYAPSLEGHPQLYCRVISRLLLDAGHDVCILSPSQKGVWNDQWPLLRPLSDESRVVCEDARPLSETSNGMVTAESLSAIQSKQQIDATLFIEGDKFADQFRRIAGGDVPRLRGRLCAICDRAGEWYPGEDAYTGRCEPMVGPTVRRTLGRIRRSLFQRRQSSRYYYEHVLIRRRTVDALIVKDERIAERFGPPVFWMPEIYRVFDPLPEERRGSDWDRCADPVRNFIERAGAGNVLLYFGTAAWYKGYDYFLRLADLDSTVFALHAGAPLRHEPNKKMAFDTAALREHLLRQGRLFETNGYVESVDLVWLVFQSIDRFVSTHRLTLSSGTMLQALGAGKPVLTPETGLVGHRTRKYNLGMTYPYRDIEHLSRQWTRFKAEPAERFHSGIQAFMKRFSKTSVTRTFLDLLVGTGCEC